MNRRPLISAVLAALLFGAATPAGKVLLKSIPPLHLAGLLYLGAAMGVLPLIIRERSFSKPWKLDNVTLGRLIGAIFSGGVLGPVCLLLGLKYASATSVSLWLNLELIATALLGYYVFREHISTYGWFAVAGMILASFILSVSGTHAGLRAGFLVALACVFWGIDNHLTALICGISPAQVTFWKGLSAGLFNLSLGAGLERAVFSPRQGVYAVVVGLFSYGLSIVLYVGSAQQIGPTRSQIVFSSAPFFGALLAVTVLREPFLLPQMIATLVMILSLLVLFVDHHSHMHHHETVDHQHWHRHDDLHHDHSHAFEAPRDVFHTHRHVHESVRHKHTHWPDQNHRHTHS